MKFSQILLFFVCFATTTLFAQRPERLNSAEIYQALEKLNVLGSALYVAAHPDDENTRLITWLSNDQHMNTAYISLTRGDGGQNLIGTQIEELLGVIRTQELLAARRTDGGTQFFSRANDFGFSKHPDETLKIWNKDEVLADLVWAVRKWQPDVIVNRFHHESAGKTHGHHTASAMLAVEAFDLAADPKAYPEQLKYVPVWQPRREFFNTSWWFYGSQEKFDAADKSKMVAVDAGTYLPLRGKSIGEISAESRSMHKSQGFGSVGNRGESLEYLELVKGDMPSDQKDLFQGINTTWSRVAGGAPIGDLVKKALDKYDFNNPGASVPQLMEVLKKIEALPDGYWKQAKLAEVKRIIANCLGLYYEAVAAEPSATPGQEVNLTIEAINRSGVNCVLQSVRYQPLGLDSVLNAPLANNKGFSFKKKLVLPQNLAQTNAYWLNDNWSLGMFNVPDQLLRGLPETPKQFKVEFVFLIENQPFTLEREVAYKKDDDVKGEVYRPFEVVPPVFVNFAEEALLFADAKPRNVAVVVKSGAANVSGSLFLDLPKGWRAEPASANFDLKLKGEEKTLGFQVYPSTSFTEGTITPKATVGGRSYTQSLTSIEYDHIPAQTVLRNAELKVARTDLKRAGDKIAYIMGAGDKVPDGLRQAGYQVDLLADQDITLENLKKYDAVVIGIRAYNTVERLKFHQPKLFDYAKQGGTVVVQYNTNGTLVPDAEITPYKLKISRDRTTVEEAEMRLLAPDHPVLNSPNKITAKDFEGWVQERGLYFPSEWGPEYTPILSCNDPGEPARDGSLLVAKYGDGWYVYTGLSFFRELPSGVPGAYRLFANLVGLGKGAR
ncbi:MAG: PIG-L family deacetylase [Saprospiraceae bacterium]|jgi:LmbE family N-acetylglucosaminyl deacetylase|nr:PIG-L family deacetylase [Saprospiraceae bacterium]